MLEYVEGRQACFVEEALQQIYDLVLPVCGSSDYGVIGVKDQRADPALYAPISR